jgi:hypothetical protein
LIDKSNQFLYSQTVIGREKPFSSKKKKKKKKKKKEKKIDEEMPAGSVQ